MTEVVPDGASARVSERAISPGDPLVEGSRIADFGDVPPGGLLVRVKTFSTANEPLVERLARVSVSGDYALTVVVTRNCEGVVCPEPAGDQAASTCDRGKCVKPECTVATPEHCPAAECVADADCHADAACVSTRCLQGTCLFVPNDSKCDPKQTCDVALGCTPPLGECKPSSSTELRCDDGVDDDCDGKIDCIDSDCDGKTCEDGDLCTEGETCAKSACNGGAPKSCDDTNACTDDTCDSKVGCVHTNKASGSCDDGNPCTDGDTCVDGKCTAGTPATCDDKNPCTDDSCDAAKGCVNANNTKPCNDGNACTDGDVCAGGACKPGAAKNCDDGNVCTTDSCNPATGCTKTNNTEPCSDNVFCNGADTCSGGSCTTHAGDPCGQVCDEASNKCVGCLNAADCGPVTYGAWSACGGFADACDTTGTQSRTVTTPSCGGGTCTNTVTNETRACTRVTEAASCGAVTYGAWSACGGFANTCDESGTQSRSVTTPTCRSGACVNEASSQSQACVRNTDGVSCGTTTYGAWSACGGFANACDTTGSQSRSRTTFTCVTGTCTSAAGSESQSCTRTVANGTGCGTGKYCCSGSCVAQNSTSHCSSCGVVCGSGSSCASIGSGHYTCTCSTNAQCVSWGFGTGATCYDSGAGMRCNCQCTGADCCAGGADCYKPSGQNYCSY